MEIELETPLATASGSGTWLECVSADHDRHREAGEDSAAASAGEAAPDAARPKRSPIPIEAWVRRQFGKELADFLAPPRRHRKCKEWHEARMPDLSPSATD